jgi:hypothetical protein
VRRILFLDIDGVLNSRRWFERSPLTGPWGTGGSAKRDDMLSHLDPTACARAQRLCEETGSEIVISSTWRLLYKLSALRHVLALRGLTVPVLGRTPSSHVERGHEIQAWLDRHGRKAGVTGMVILDDDRDMVHLTPWLVRTRFEHGLTDEDVTRAKRTVRAPMPEVRSST